VAKSAPKDLMHTPLIIGNFTFKNSNLAKELISYLQDNEIRVNNEFYLDSVIDVALQQGMAVSFIQVKSFMALGTEYELNVHNYYWNSIRNENG
jgi:bifunctional N-acetylglucosamine-1-phosphate-uridyltransferase/glucosamine-1-phosphate-acetyltransferase GlmU-like protein